MTKTLRLVRYLTIIGAIGARVHAQSPAPLPGAKAADSLFRAENWSGAATAYRAMIKLDSTRPMPWARLSTSEYHLGKFADAGEHYLRAGAITRNPAHFYNAGAAFAMAHDSKRTFAALDSALGAGFADTAQLLADTDLAGIRNDPRFAAFAKRVYAKAKPCAVDAQFRAFDFWLGSWVVRTPQGDQAGASTVTVAAGDCAIVETWEPRAGAPGKSLSTFNKAQGKWQQLYIDSQGNVQQFTGSDIPGGMVFERTPPSGTTTSNRFRMTLTKQANGDVRQLGERSPDGGQTWTTEYDLVYSPRPR